MNMNLSPWNLSQPTKYAEVVKPICVVAMGDAPGPFSAIFPSTRPYNVAARHSGRANLLFLAGQVQSYSGAYIGCGVGDPKHDDVSWLTGTASDSQASAY
jgi:hypothetical protein